MEYNEIVVGSRTEEFRCRVCLEFSSKMYPLEGPIANCDVDIATMLCFCTSVEVSLSKDLPSFVCIPCFKTLRIAYNFINQFRENNEKLMNEKLNLKVETPEPVEVKSESNGSDQIIKSENETEIVENVEELHEYATFMKLEDEMSETNHISGMDDFKLVHEEVQEEVEENIQVSMEEIDQTLNSDEECNNEEAANHNQSVPRVKIKLRYACPVCPQIYFSKFEIDFVNHMMKHKEISFYCNCCEDGIIYDGNTYIKHFRDVHLHQCPYCHKSCPTKLSLNYHLRRSHSNTKYCCNYKGCSKVFTTNFCLKKHETVHSEDVKHVCEECGLEFKTYDTYRYHQKKHGGRKFLCTHCGRTFMQSIHLKYHMWLHTGIKQFRCDMCDKSYTTVTQLKKHKRQHHPNEEEGNGSTHLKGDT